MIYGNSCKEFKNYSNCELADLENKSHLDFGSSDDPLTINRYLRQCLFDRNREPVTSGLGIAFCSDRLRVTSVVLHADLSDPEKVKERLRALGTSYPPLPNRSIGFIFACVGRGKAHYDGSRDVESNAFKQLYPGIPLLGFFGGGEIGYDFPQLSTSAVDFTLFHSYTSIFVLLTFT